MGTAPLCPKHGGYRKLKSVQIAQPVCDVTVSFYKRSVDKRSRTHAQMVQGFAEESPASGSQKKPN
ncbi:hypothetical protein [Chlorobium phaeobacteroides]|jgi:hypothetical protein|uniref:hypothetical protein n=1 Tax=Chlorobium phaeobacteroides TaxID=1096 RepID=UPI0003226DE9|nr:hypothetical protein [Chlorobium phaeobacteroides]